MLVPVVTPRGSHDVLGVVLDLLLHLARDEVKKVERALHRASDDDSRVNRVDRDAEDGAGELVRVEELERLRGVHLDRPVDRAREDGRHELTA